MRIDRSNRKILCQSFDEPQRQRLDAAAGAAASRSRAVRRDVVLEGMHKLVAENMVGLGQRAGERQHDAALHPLGDAARSLADHAADDVGLLEVRVRRIENEGLARLHLVLEDARQARIPALSHPADARGAFALVFVEINIEVVGLQHFELEIFVLDLVPSEVLRLSGHGGSGTDEENRQAG